MTISSNQLSTEIEYPDADGKPMAESDATRQYLIYGTEVLRLYFQQRQDVYVSGNLFIYYQQGNPSAVVAPDVFVVFGVPNHPRRSYKTWEEGNKTPDFALEITSKTTKKEDTQSKPNLYAALGVREYFKYDPSGDYLKPQLQGSCLVAGIYQPIAATILSDNVLSTNSEVLGLQLRIEQGELRFYQPLTGQRLLSHEEEIQARLAAEQAQVRAERSQLQAEQERQKAEERAQRLAAKLRELNIEPDN